MLNIYIYKKKIYIYIYVHICIYMHIYICGPSFEMVLESVNRRRHTFMNLYTH